MKRLFITTLVLSLSACGGSDSNNQNGGSGFNSQNQTYRYDFEENGCKTKAHEFSSQQAYCEGLKDSRLNEGCAYTLRKIAFRQNCTGFGNFDGTPPPAAPSSNFDDAHRALEVRTTVVNPVMFRSSQGGRLTTTLSGQVNGIELIPNRPLVAHFSQVNAKVASPAANGCTLTSIVFTDSNAQGSTNYFLTANEDYQGGNDISQTTPCTRFIAQIYHEGATFKLDAVKTDDASLEGKPLDVTLVVAPF